VSLPVWDVTVGVVLSAAGFGAVVWPAWPCLPMVLVYLGVGQLVLGLAGLHVDAATRRGVR
jgi:hypothetical protein